MNKRYNATELTMAQKIRLANAYASGVSQAELARQYGITVLTVRRILREQGVPVRRGRPRLG